MNSHKNARTTPFARALIVERRQSGEGVDMIAASLGISVRTVYKWLSRHRKGGCAALENGASAPGRPARAIGQWWVEAAAQLRRDYRMTAAEIAERLRLARSTVEVLPDEKRATTTGFTVRALRWFRTRGIIVERIMTDNGSAYVSRLFAKVLRWLKIRHIRTRPYTPRTNGKAERFIQTLLREWAYAIPYRSSESRNLDLARYLDWYNTDRPHYALAKQSPAKRLNDLLNNVLRNDN